MSSFAQGRLCAPPSQRSRSLPIVLGVIAAIGFVTALVAPARAEQKSVTVPQGDVGRWSGEGTQRCGMDGRAWEPLDGTCWYPIDFERKPGRIEIARWLDGGRGIETAWLIIEEKEFELQEIDFPDDSYVHLSPEDLARHYREQSETKPIYRRRSGPPRFTLALGQPLESPPEGKYFGVRRKFNGEPKNAHTGTDYAIGLGTSVKSVAKGTVVLIAEHFFAGKSVYVDHGDGLISMYYHLSEFKVEVGQEVERGDEVALVGSTGRSTGPHLHLGIRWRRARIDPAALLRDPSQAPAVAD